MLKNNLELNNKISSKLQEAPIDFYFVNIIEGGFLYFGEDQLIMSKNTKDKLVREEIIDDNPQTASNTMIVDNLNDGFVYLGKIYENLEVNKNGDINLKYLNPICLMYVK